MKPARARAMTYRLRRGGRFVLAFLALTTSTIALGAVDPTPAGGTAIGSTGSFGVSSDFGLAGGEDSIRFPDATTVVLERT